jgi:hypothetical protein
MRDILLNQESRHSLGSSLLWIGILFAAFSFGFSIKYHRAAGRLRHPLRSWLLRTPFEKTVDIAAVIVLVLGFILTEI